MAWKEMSGTKKVEMHGSGPGPHYIDVLVSFVGIEGTDNLAAAMPIPGDLIGGGSSGNLDSSYGTTALDGEPVAVQVSQADKLNELRCTVTVRFRGYIVE